MLRTLRLALVAATLSLPALASANVNARNPMTGGQPSSENYITGATSAGDTAALGSGMVWGNDPGHVTGPGRTQIDNDSRGPFNQADVSGVNTGNTKKTVTPKPVY